MLPPSDGGTRPSSSTRRRPLPTELNYELLKCVPASSGGLLLLCTSHTMRQLFSGQKPMKLWRRKVHLEQDGKRVFGEPAIHAIIPSEFKNMASVGRYSVADEDGVVVNVAVKVDGKPYCFGRKLPIMIDFDGFDDVSVPTRYCSKMPNQRLRFVVLLCNGGVIDANAVAKDARDEFEEWRTVFGCQISEMGNQGCGMPLLQVTIPFENFIGEKFYELLEAMDAIINANDPNKSNSSGGSGVVNLLAPIEQ